jgi:methyl-accepting chemotaxis protein
MDNRRASKIVKAGFQHKMAITLVLVALLSTNLVTQSAFVLERWLGSFYPDVDVFWVAMAALQVVTIAVMYGIGLRISYRIAGPVYAMERRLRQMQKGDLAQSLTLRDGDQFGEAADTLNETIADYGERIVKLREMTATLTEQQSSSELDALQGELDWYITRKPE